MVAAKAVQKRQIVFLGVGVFNTLADFLFYTFLTSTIFRGGKHIALAGIISGTFALLCAFLTHSQITWRDSYVSHRTVFKFIAFTGFGMWVIRPLLLSLFIHFNGLYHWVYNLCLALHLPFSYNFITNTGAFGFMTIVLLVYNYYTYNRFVFNRRGADQAIRAQNTDPETHSAT